MQSALIADTDKVFCEFLVEELASLGIETVIANRDDRAYQLFLERSFSMAFIDVLLPRKGGLDLLRRIRATDGGAELPVLITCSMRGYTDLRQEAMDLLGAKCFMQKPCSKGDLEIHLKKALGDACLERDSSCVVKDAFLIDEIDEAGDLGHTPFSLIFNSLSDRTFSGRLNVARDKVKKIVFFDKGQVAFARSNRVSETLGRYMREKGLIDESTYCDTLEALQQSDKKFGELLEQTATLEPYVIDRAVRDNVRSKVAELFAWQTGHYSLTPEFDSPITMPGDPLSSRGVILKGVLGHMKFGEILAIIRPYMGHYIHVRSDPLELLGESSVNERYFPLFKAANSFVGQTVEELLTASQNEQELRVLLALLMLGVFMLCTTSEPPQDMPEDEKDLEINHIIAVRQRLGELRAANCFRVLNVSANYTDDQVHTAYKELAATYHPDTAGTEHSAELHHLLSEMFVLIQNAYDSLRTAGDRKRYLKTIQAPLDSDTLEASRILEAENQFQQGLGAANRRDWQAALVHLKSAHEQNADEPEYALQCGIAFANSHTGERQHNTEEARRLFLVAAKLDGDSADPYYRLGLLSKFSNDNENAMTYFQRAVIRDPGHIEARRELRLMNSRGQIKKKGVFSSLMGRK
jgi:CheY-like chemotaxis protein